MKFAYDIFPPARAIVASYAGKFSLEELMGTAQQLWSDPRYDRTFDGVVDLTNGALRVEMPDLRALVDFLRADKNTSAGRWAAIAVSPVVTACGLIYKGGIAPRHAFEIFSTREAASWFVGFSLGDGPLSPGGAAPRRH